MIFSTTQLFSLPKYLVACCAGRRSFFRFMGFGLFALALSGCSAAPSISVLGAYFPAWMFCILGGMALTLVLRALLEKGLRVRVGWPVLTYPALLLLFSLLAWLAFFSS